MMIAEGDTPGAAGPVEVAVFPLLSTLPDDRAEVRSALAAEIGAGTSLVIVFSGGTLPVVRDKVRPQMVIFSGAVQTRSRRWRQT